MDFKWTNGVRWTDRAREILFGADGGCEGDTNTSLRKSLYVQKFLQWSGWYLVYIKNKQIFQSRKGVEGFGDALQLMLLKDIINFISTECFI